MTVPFEGDVFIGAGAVVRSGAPGKPVRTRRRATIGMGAAATKDVRAGTTFAGNRAWAMKSQASRAERPSLAIDRDASKADHWTAESPRPPCEPPREEPPMRASASSTVPAHAGAMGVAIEGRNPGHCPHFGRVRRKRRKRVDRNRAERHSCSFVSPWREPLRSDWRTRGRA